MPVLALLALAHAAYAARIPPTLDPVSTPRLSVIGTAIIGTIIKVNRAPVFPAMGNLTTVVGRGCRAPRRLRSIQMAMA